jgi:hypothetical protein
MARVRFERKGHTMIRITRIIVALHDNGIGMPVARSK